MLGISFPVSLGALLIILLFMSACCLCMVLFFVYGRLLGFYRNSSSLPVGWYGLMIPYSRMAHVASYPPIPCFSRTPSCWWFPLAFFLCFVSFLCCSLFLFFPALSFPLPDRCSSPPPQPPYHPQGGLIGILEVGGGESNREIVSFRSCVRAGEARRSCEGERETMCCV